MDQRHVGGQQKQSQGTFLFADSEGASAARRKDKRMAAVDASDGTDSGWRTEQRGGLVMFRRRRSTDDFAEEIKSHLELEADELESEGLSEEEARRRAKVEFGN